MWDIDERAVRDCFASAQNWRFPKFYDKEMDALAQDWLPGEVHWCNPPWSLWPATTTKIFQSIGMSIAIFPAWHSQPWVKALLSASVKMIYYEVGTKIFELGDKAVGGIRWGLYVTMIVTPQRIHQVQQVPTWSSSSRRRYRRKQHNALVQNVCL